MDIKPQTSRNLQKRSASVSSDEPSSSKKPKQKVNTNATAKTSSAYAPLWSPHELLAEQQNLSLEVAESVIKLLEEGNTIPFIARYRREVTNYMSPETLRDVKETYEEISALKNKISTVLKNLEKTKSLSDPLKKSVTSSRSIEELEYVYAPYKPGGKRSLAERAKELGLEEPATCFLNNSTRVDLFNYVQKGKKELENVKDVEKGIVHIIASVIATDTDLLSFLRDLRSQVNFHIKSKKLPAKENKKPTKPAASSSKPVDDTKFDTYSDFEIPTKFIKPHQVLAINRGESLKILSVKVVVPDKVLSEFTTFCTHKWVNRGMFDEERKRIMHLAIQDAYNRLVQPLIIREIRHELKIKAEKASCEVFSTNLKHLLLAPPLKGKKILGIDPGFANGCKIALVSPMGTVLDYAVIHPHKSKNPRDVGILKDMLLRHNCDLIALGNGTGCRQTEEWLTNLIQAKTFHPLDIQYTIVNEDGASIYSCGAEAKKEFPKLDPNIISAVSLARRVQEPLAELVKIEPKHLGVGMYQHDLKKKQLEESLDEVVSECVSFVGVDLNTTSQCLLRHIAGLSDKRATQIIVHREQNGPFVCRKQLLDVFGIGEKVFQQCAGFLRVGPSRVEDFATFYQIPKTTKLDCTYVHPESYKIATKLMKKLQLKISDIGDHHFIGAVKNQMSIANFEKLSVELGAKQEELKLIFDALSKPLNHDLRSDCTQTPLFRKGLTSIEDLRRGTTLTGRIVNVTHFGCFVDVGVGISGLIHSSKFKGMNLRLGDRVEVVVLSVEIQKKRIGLEPLKIL